MDAPETPPVAAPKPPTPAAEPKAPAAAPDKSEPTAPEKVEGDGLPKFQTNKDLRKYAGEQLRAAKEAAAKVTEYENRVKELEAKVPQSQQGAELLAAQLAEANAKLAQHEQTVEAIAFENSAKYQTEYAKPYYDALARAEKEVAEFTVNEPTGEVDENEQPMMKQRPATKADFQKIYNLPRTQAWDLAEKMFGPRDAKEVMDHRKTISELAEKAKTAVQERRTNYKAVKEREQAQESTKRIGIDRLWKTANETISKDPKRAQYWGDDKDDPESNKALANGFKLADEFFSEKRDQMKPEERVEFDAYIRHTIAMGPRLAYKVNKLTAALKARDEEIAQLRGSVPGAPKPTGEEAPKTPSSTQSAIDALGN